MALSDDDRAALSAYLDGELDDEATHRIEVRLTSDPELRLEYETLRQTWSLLDYLPRSSPSSEFTNRTMAQLTLERQSSSWTWISQVAGRVPALALAWAAAVVVAAWAGVAIGGWLTAPAQSDSIIDPDDRQWLTKQPQALQAQALALNGDAARNFVRKLREEDQRSKEAWEEAARFWQQFNGVAAAPSRLADLSPKDQEGVGDYLMPFLSEEERKQLTDTEGQFPKYIMTLVELSDKHPFALPSANGPRTFDELPKVVRERFRLPTTGPANTGVALLIAQKHEGKPPLEYAKQVVSINQNFYARKMGSLPRELWANNYNALSPPMQNYVEKTLRRNVTDAEMVPVNAANAQNKWPDYPLAIQKLADEHPNLPPPPWETALSGSGPPERWNEFRIRKVAQ